MLKRMEIFLIAAVFILITAVILIIYSKQREQEFISHHATTQEAIVNGAAYAINLQLLEKKRHVHLFANEYAHLFVQLNTNPMNEKFEDDIKIRLQQRFPDFFTYTVTDQSGVPKLLNIESLVGNACQRDLSDFAKQISTNSKDLQNKVFIHPQPFNYHYDIMAPIYTAGVGPRIFFISFYLKEITDILKTHELPGQSLILVRQSDTRLIEVSSQGTRDTLKRDLNLSDAELQRIIVHKNIPGTDWRLVNLPDPAYLKQYQKVLWNEALFILIIVTIAMFILIFVMIKMAKNREV